MQTSVILPDSETVGISVFTRANTGLWLQSLMELKNINSAKLRSIDILSAAMLSKGRTAGADIVYVPAFENFNNHRAAAR